MKIRNINFSCFFILGAAGFFIQSSVSAQPFSLSKEQMIIYTPLWKGERFSDGRPRVSDDIVERMRYVSITSAWGSLRGLSDTEASLSLGARETTNTYLNQYYGGFKRLYDNVLICGRASTIHFMPLRPDVNSAILSEAGKKGFYKEKQITWGIQKLRQGDVYVANVCDGYLDASHVGDNLGATIFTKSGNGAIIRGTVRDVAGQPEGMNFFVRDFRPESNSSNMVMGTNCPIQIGYVTVMPGDIVLANFEGVVFIPAHLAKAVVESSEKQGLRDIWAHEQIKLGHITAAQADGGYTDAMNKEFNKWALDNADNMGKYYKDPKAAPSPEFIRAYIKDREQNPPEARSGVLR